MSAVGKILAAMIALVITAFVAGSVFAPGITSSLLGQALGQQANEPSAAEVEREAAAITGTPYPGDPVGEQKLADAESARLVAVRTAASTGASKALDTTKPFRAGTEGRPTLILPARETPYGLRELARLAPETMTADGPEGAFVLHQHLAVMTGATLTVTAGQRLLLTGDDSGFSSIVALGGTIRLDGTADHRVTLASWNPTSGGLDELTDDGRPYLRVDGGDLSVSATDVDALGFWMGETSGIAFDGRPSTELAAAPGKDGGDGVPTLGLTPEPAAAGVLVIDSTRVRGNAVGLEVRGTAHPAISDVEVTGSLVDGVVLAGDVSGAKLSKVAVAASARDGLVLGRGSTSVSVTGASVVGSGRNGLLLEGTPVGDGPRTETPVPTSRGLTVAGSVFRDNARVGVDVVGGSGIRLRDVDVSGGRMGIVLEKAPRDVEVAKSTVTGAARHGISVRDGATDVTISSNTVTRSDIGVYVRNADAAVNGNTVSQAGIHGIALSGRLDGTLVTDNRLSGTGPTAIDSDRALDARVEGNLVDGWAASRTLEQLLTTVMQPLTIVWMLIVTVVIVALITRLGGGRKRGDPLRDPRPLQAMSRGIMTRADAVRFTTGRDSR